VRTLANMGTDHYNEERAEVQSSGDRVSQLQKTLTDKVDDLRANITLLMTSQQEMRTSLLISLNTMMGVLNGLIPKTEANKGRLNTSTTTTVTQSQAAVPSAQHMPTTKSPILIQSTVKTANVSITLSHKPNGKHKHNNNHSHLKEQKHHKKEHPNSAHEPKNTGQKKNHKDQGHTSIKNKNGKHNPTNKLQHAVVPFGKQPPTQSRPPAMSKLKGHKAITSYRPRAQKHRITQNPDTGGRSRAQKHPISQNANTGGRSRAQKHHITQNSDTGGRSRELRNVEVETELGRLLREQYREADDF